MKGEKSLKAKEFRDLPRQPRWYEDHLSLQEELGLAFALMGPSGSGWSKVWPVALLYCPGNHTPPTANLTTDPVKRPGQERLCNYRAEDEANQDVIYDEL